MNREVENKKSYTINTSRRLGMYSHITVYDELRFPEVKGRSTDTDGTFVGAGGEGLMSWGGEGGGVGVRGRR